MATAIQTAPAVLTMEEYLQTSYHPDREFIDGSLEERTMGSTNHSELQFIIGTWFRNRRREWRIRIMGEVRTRVSGERMRLPDVAILRRTGPREYPALTTPPLIVIELLSPDDRLNRVLERLEDFLKMGVEHIWLIDPEERVAYTYTASGLLLQKGQTLTLPDSPIYLDLSEIFAELDESEDEPQPTSPSQA